MVRYRPKTQYKPKKPAYEFLALSVDFSSPSPDPLTSRRPAHAGVK